MSNPFFILLAACAVGALTQQYVKYGRSKQRRVYWGCASLGTIAAFLAFYPVSKNGIGMALFFLGAMTVVAYAYTPYIKIRGKVYVLTVQDSQPDPDDHPDEGAPTTCRAPDPAPDAYSGLLSATKMWSLLIPLMVISTGNIYAFGFSRGEWWVAAIGLAFIVFLAVAMGYGDASWGYGVARGHHVQFVIAAIVTLGAFAGLYLAANQTGKRWPSRRKQSMEYHAHPRHQKLD